MEKYTLEPNDILTPDQLADRLHVSRNWIYEKTRFRGSRDNPLPCLRMGRYLRFAWSEVIAWLHQNSATA